MGLLSLTLPTIGQPNATEDAKVRDALSAIQTEFNGNISPTNLDSNVTQQLVPTGTIMAFAGSSAPSGYLLCDGSEVTRGSFSTLFGIIGESYGPGDGSTTFNLPDLRGRVAVGMGTNAAVDALGENEGITTVANRTPKHWHDADNLAANYWRNAPNGFAGGNEGITRADGQQGPSFWEGGHIDVLGDVGTTTAAQDTPSYQVVNYIIKT